MAKKVVKIEGIDELEKFLNEEMGEEGFHRGSEEIVYPPIPTGLLSLDAILGGGLPRGRITEIFGPPSSGKTLLLLAAMANAQKEGGIAVYEDLERSFDPHWSELNGVDIKSLRVIKPTSGESAYDILLQYLQTKKIAIFGVDSVAQIVPSGELAGSMTDVNIGLAARLNAKAMRKITNDLGDTAVVLINQTRQNVTTGPFQGNPETTSGGKAIPFYASLRLNVRRIGWTKSGEEKIGAVYRCKIEKCKIRGAKLHAVAEFEVDFVRGLDIAKDILTNAMARNLVEKRGSWFKIDEDTKFQGEAAIKDYLLSSGLCDKWRQQILDESLNSDPKE